MRAMASGNMQLPHRASGVHTPMTATGDAPSTLQLWPAELLLKAAKSLDRTEDLENLRLVNRSFSKAATTALQDRFVRIHIFPTRPSMARFSRLTMNNLIAPKILQIVVTYCPPFATTASPICHKIAQSYNMPRKKLQNIVSEFNEMCVDPEIFTDDKAAYLSLKINVVESGEFERVLGEGIERLPALCSVSIRSDINARKNEPWPSLNLPEYVRYGLLETEDAIFDAIQNLSVAEFVKHAILRTMYLECTGRGSPTNIIGALRRWPSGLRKEPCSLSFVVSHPGRMISNMGSMNEDHWTTALTSRPLLLDDCMINITRIALSVKSHAPLESTVAEFDIAGEQHPDLTLAPHWCKLLQAAVNLKFLELISDAPWAIGFDSLLNHVFKECTWQDLVQLSIEHPRNIKLLPTETLPPLYRPRSTSWYCFLQKDLDKFLLRHKASLESLSLHNIVGLEQQPIPPPLSWQWIAPGFPEDPTPSLAALDNSLNLWVRELSNLKEISVVISAEVEESRKALNMLKDWLKGSEIQALATVSGVESEVMEVMDERTSCSSIVFDLADSKRCEQFEGVSDDRIEWALAHGRVDYM